MGCGVKGWGVIGELWEYLKLEGTHREEITGSAVSKIFRAP